MSGTESRKASRTGYRGTRDGIKKGNYPRQGKLPARGKPAMTRPYGSATKRS